MRVAAVAAPAEFVATNADRPPAIVVAAPIRAAGRARRDGTASSELETETLGDA
jgi:hypothetical protein